MSRDSIRTVTHDQTDRQNPGGEGLRADWADARLRILDEKLRASGLFVRGGFHPANSDDVPAMPGGTRPKTVILAGNAGSEMWERFQAALTEGDAPDPLDRWLESILKPASEAVNAHLILPNLGPPFVPIIDWATRAEDVYRSPIGIMIHPDFGLWHVYRAALLFGQRLELPPRRPRENPCTSCKSKPCLRVCPADAFGPERFDFASCHTHVSATQNNACRMRGCMARRVCPVGHRYLYPREAQTFHTEFFLRAAGRMVSARE